MSTDTNPPASKKLWTQRLEGGTGKLGGGILTIARGLFSPDRPTRRMSIVFFASLFTALFSLVWGIERYRNYLSHREHVVTESEIASQHLSDFVAKQAEENKHKASQFGMGTFQIEILPAPDQVKAPGLINMAEADITIQCDDRDTRDYVDAHSVEARNQVAAGIVPMQRGELLTRDGKARLKKSIIDRLNGWLPHGKVVDVYFTRLIAT